MHQVGLNRFLTSYISFSPTVCDRKDARHKHEIWKCAYKGETHLESQSSMQQRISSKSTVRVHKTGNHAFLAFVATWRQAASDVDPLTCDVSVYRCFTNDSDHPYWGHYLEWNKTQMADPPRLAVCGYVFFFNLGSIFLSFSFEILCSEKCAEIFKTTFECFQFFE